MAPVAAKCCRSTPRCAQCPVVLLSRHRHGSAAQRLLVEIMTGPQRPLPPAVAEQLELLSAAQRS